MTSDNLRDIAEALRDLRFIQASSIVALRLKESKQTTAYMNKLAVLQQICEQESLESLI